MILSLAEWRINVNEMLSYIQKGTELYTRFNEWIDMNKIPQYVESLRFQKQSIVIQDNEVYSNQFIFGFYRGNY